MVEIAHKGWEFDLMGMVLVCAWKDGYGDVGLSVGWNLETFPDLFVVLRGRLVLCCCFLVFFPVPPIWIPKCPPFFFKERKSGIHAVLNDFWDMELGD
jgi:hypothetical protein